MTWVLVTGGTHHCMVCGKSVTASAADGVWVFYVNDTTSTAAVCGTCSEEV
jgi:hypothetical protein